jgi:hypothetical protein
VSDALGRAQDWLASTLERALAEQDREFTKRVREEATALAGCFNGLLRMARTHSLDNLAFEAPTAELSHRLGALSLLPVEEDQQLGPARPLLPGCDQAPVTNQAAPPTSATTSAPHNQMIHECVLFIDMLPSP